MLLRELGERRTQMHDAEGERRGDPKGPGRIALALGNGSLCLFKVREGAACPLGKKTAGFRWDKPTRGSNEESRPEFCLKASHAPADHRLRNAEPARRLRVALKFDDAGEGQDVVEVAHLIVPLRSTLSCRPSGYRPPPVNAILQASGKDPRRFQWPPMF
jgi:hypothetical protein